MIDHSQSSLRVDDKPFLLAMKVFMGRRPLFPEGAPRDYQRIAEKCWQGEPRDRPSFETVLTLLSMLVD